ncbi:hypothetical protein [Aliarcobacter cryaerophilus]|uniref:hypothetical protein n=1 Tax=Aliarcobacter cryaerophilus TaxID=28198 RepID=UPI0021B2285B|nr:hypothetical protein [Aliarcobacter cryaerophilus]MCT7510951.1 hypothetical protein [Aliarcobacter cryaerophilus]
MKKTKNDFNKIKNIEDLCSMVEKRIPNNSENNSEYFTAVNRTLLKAGYIYCILKNKREIDDLLKLIKSSKIELLENLEDFESLFHRHTIGIHVVRDAKALIISKKEALDNKGVKIENKSNLNKSCTNDCVCGRTYKCDIIKKRYATEQEKAIMTIAGEVYYSICNSFIKRHIKHNKDFANYYEFRLFTWDIYDFLSYDYQKIINILEETEKKYSEGAFYDTDFTLEKDGIEIKKIIRDAIELISDFNPQADVNHTSFLEAVSNPDFFKN